MKLSFNQGGKFIPCDEGTWRGVCVDVTPLVKRETKFGVREEFRLVFETDAPERNDQTRQCIWSRGFTPSLHEKASFRKFLRQWQGRDLTKEEENDLDTESFVGISANLVIAHEQGDNGEVYANIIACTPYRGNDPLVPSGKFIRKKDKKEEGEANGEQAGYRRAASAETEVPKGEAVDDTQAGANWPHVKVHVGNHQGVEVCDLDPAALERLLSKWLPIYHSNPRPTADDKRLAAALLEAKKHLAQMAAQAPCDY
jgi:hypothetical protein